MQSLKSIIGLLRAIVPVAYCGGLIYYFVGQGGTIEDIKTIGLWPTVVGLGVVGLLFCIPLLLKIAGLIFVLRTRGPRPPGGPLPQEDSFDADAVIARYKARQPAEAAVAPPPVRPRAMPDRPPSFGRRSR